MNPTGLRQSLIQQAHRLGFVLVGFTSPDPPPHFPTFTQWVDAGHHGSMEYLSNKRSLERRSNPRFILPECKSILMLGIPYTNPDRFHPTESKYIHSPSKAATLKGRVASYAWGEDYHSVLERKLVSLIQFIQVHLGHEIPKRYYTDTGPVLERDLAQRAGLGWIGKNSCLIHPKHGSYFFLAEILLGIDIEPDPTFKTDHCGTCTRCIDACPTECILPNRTINAQRCISYLTVENKSDIPENLRPALGNWVFGCDVCQMVCPWNRFSPRQIDESFSPKPGLQSPDLIHEITFSTLLFNQKFRGNPIKRAKRRGYLRNVAVALGNTLNSRAIPALEKAAKDSEALIRLHAVWAIRHIQTEEHA